MASFDDRIFPEVDISNTERYEYAQYGDKDFLYDTKNNEVLYVYEDDNGKWRKVDSLGMSESNWYSPNMRELYLKKYVDQIETSETTDDEVKTESVMKRRNKIKHIKNSYQSVGSNIIEYDDTDGDMLVPNTDNKEDDYEILNELQPRFHR